MNVERRIVTGMIVSTDYLRRVAPFWSDERIEAPEMRRVCRWCLDYFAKYDRAPDRDIEQVYMTAIRDEALPKAEAELIEIMLQGISEDYERGDTFNAMYLYDQTVTYFRDQEQKRHLAIGDELRERGQTEEADRHLSNYSPLSWATSRGLDVGTEAGYARIRAAFDTTSQPLVEYPGALGDLLNPHLVRDGFVCLMGPEKRGKTHWLTDIAFRALKGTVERPGYNVAFFGAGDMTESQYLVRFAVHMAGKSNLARYCEERWIPVNDCAHNQFDRCSRADRNCDHGVYGRDRWEEFQKDQDAFQSLEDLVELAKKYPDYRPCDAYGCNKYWPLSWVGHKKATTPLTADMADRIVRRFFDRYRRRFRLACYPSGTLTVDEIDSCLGEWENQDFVPDVVVVDYWDIMASGEREYRHRQNDVGIGLRKISQKRHVLVATATQADAASYKRDSMDMSNFSEDKRKFGHVTAMFGLNQDRKGREKSLGVMRLNALVAREGAFSVTDEVCVLQDLAAGRPFLGSYKPGSVKALLGGEIR